MTQILRVLPRLKGTIPGAEASLVPDPHGTEASPQRRRIIGRKHQQVSPGQWAWVPTGKIEELPYHHDIAKAVQDGDLWAVDEATARACRAKFDSTFSGEYNADGSPANSQQPVTTSGDEENV